MRRFAVYASIVVVFRMGIGLGLVWLPGSRSGEAAAAPVPGAAEGSADGMSIVEGPRAEGHIEPLTARSPTELAEVLHVCPIGCAYSSIQDAVDAANDGGVIKVAAGTYTEVRGRTAPPGFAGPDIINQVVYISKTLTIQGGYTAAFADPPDPEANPTTLNAQGQGRVLLIAGSISPTVEGLRITGGDAAGLGGPSWDDDAGGGVYVLTATAVISNNWMFNNTADWGGGLHLDRSDATLSGNSVSDNNASYDGGGLYLYESNATLSGNTISGNTAGEGGGLYLYRSDATLNGNTVSHNTTTWKGGGLYLYWSDATLSRNTITDNRDGGGLSLRHSNATLSGNTVSSNIDEWGGGGLDLHDSDATIINNTITNNIARFGGGLYVSDSDATIIDNTITINVAINNGGGLSLYVSDATVSDSTITPNTADQHAGGLHLLESDATLSRNTITDNTAQGDGGGVGGGSTLSGNKISSNTAGRCGGLDGSSITLINNIITDNQTDQYGSGVCVRGSSHLVHNTIARNSGGDGSGVYVEWGTVALTNTILVDHTVGISITAGKTATLESTLWNGNATDWSGGGTVTHSNDHHGDPAFVDSDNGDYHVTSGSAAIDAGVDAGVTDDLDGQVRPMNWGHDIGADEYPGAGLEIIARPSAAFVKRGVLPYTIAVANAGVVSTTDVVLTATLDGWQMPITVTSFAGRCRITDGGWGGSVVCTPGTLAIDAMVRVTLTTRVSPGAAVGQVIVNTVAATANETMNSIRVTNKIDECHVRINDDPTEYGIVQTAVDAANPGDLVKVAGYCLGVNERKELRQQVYREELRQQVYLDKSITIRGGYTTTNWTVSDPEANPTTLDAEGQGRVLFVTGDISPTIEGLHIAGGDAAGLEGYSWPTTGPVFSDAGGGVYVYGAAATLSGCLIYNNTAQWGGGIHLERSLAKVRGNKIFSNTAENGGGIASAGGAPVVSDNIIQGNRTDGTSTRITSGGGGVYLEGCCATLSGNIVRDNTSAREGGGVLIFFVSPTPITLTNNVIADNQAALGGGMLVAGNTRAIHTTLARNIATGDGSGVYVDMSAVKLFIPATLTMTNTILVSHTVGITVTMGNTVMLDTILWHGNDANTGGSGTLTVTHQITGNPAFAADGYHITPASAALDAGADAGVTTDIDGEPRPAGAGYDAGADELPTALSVTKQASPDPVQPGELLTYTICITNTGYVTLTATITDTLPLSVTLNETSGGTLALPGGTAILPDGRVAITWTPRITAPSGLWMGTIVVTVDEGYTGPLSNLVEVTTKEGAAGTDSVTVLAIRRIYLPIVIRDAPYLSTASSARSVATNRSDSRRTANS